MLHTTHVGPTERIQYDDYRHGHEWRRSVWIIPENQLLKSNYLRTTEGIDQKEACNLWLYAVPSEHCRHCAHKLAWYGWEM